MTNQRWLGTVFDIQQRQAAVTLTAVGGTPGNNGAVQRITFTLWSIRYFAICLVYPRQSPALGHFGLTWVGQINDQGDIVGRTIDQCGHVRPAPVDVPSAMNVDAVRRQETDFPRLRGSRSIRDTQPDAPAPILHVVDHVAHRAGIIGLLVNKAGVDKQIPGVDHQQ